jgi:Na+/H+ antiporter NhaD/arsenite permease-like protein
VTEIRTADRYLVVTVAARRALQVAGQAMPEDVRFLRVAVTLVVSVVALVLALHVPPFMAAGADLSDSAQRDYAQNIWQEVQTSLGLVVLVLPWLVYGLMWQGAAWGRRILIAVATAGVVLTTWFALLSAQSYTALPQHVTGVVDRIEGRTITLRSGGSYLLVVSDSELKADHSWLRAGTPVMMWVSPREHAGSISPSAVGD